MVDFVLGFWCWESTTLLIINNRTQHNLLYLFFVGRAAFYENHVWMVDFVLGFWCWESTATYFINEKRHLDFPVASSMAPAVLTVLEEKHMACSL
jgi:hypothetical protein